MTTLFRPRPNTVALPARQWRQYSLLANLFAVLSFGLISLPTTHGQSRDYKSLLDEGDQRISQSIAAFQKGDLEGRLNFANEAFCYYSQAATQYPGKLDPIFDEGYAYVQLGRYSKALELFNRLAKLNYPSPGLDYLRGVSLIASEYPGTAGYKNGICLLQKYVCQDNEVALSGSSVQKILDDAQKALQPNAAPSPTPTPATSASPTPVPYQFVSFVQSGLGYNNNPTTSGSAQQPALFNESSFGIEKDIKFKDGDTLKGATVSLNYLFQADTFEDLPAIDYIQQTVTASLTKPLTFNLASLFKAADQWMYTDGDLKSNQATLQLALQYQPVSALKSQLSYFLIRNDGYGDPAPAKNPAGFAHRAEFQQTCVLVSDPFDSTPRLSLLGLYSHEWFENKGVELRHQQDELQLQGTWVLLHRYQGDETSFVRGINLVAGFDWKPGRYSDNAYPPNATVDRYALSEHTTTASVELDVNMKYDPRMPASVPDSNDLQFVIRYQYAKQEANVLSKNYDANSILGLFKINF